MFEIIDIQGKILLKSATPVKSVNIGGLAAGVYFIRFENSIREFIKEWVETNKDAQLDMIKSTSNDPKLYITLHRQNAHWQQ